MQEKDKQQTVKGDEGVNDTILYPRGVDSAKVICVIETKTARGSGSKAQPERIVTEYWSLKGKKLAENDPCGCAICRSEGGTGVIVTRPANPRPPKKK